MEKFSKLLAAVIACPLLAREIAQTAQVYTGTLGGETGAFDN